MMDDGGDDEDDMEEMPTWKKIAIIVPCVIGGIAFLTCLLCCCCGRGGGANGPYSGMMCCGEPSNNQCCGPMCGDQCCGPQQQCCGPQQQCCGPTGGNCDPTCGMCGPCCECGTCCPQQPVHHMAPVTTAPAACGPQYMTRGQIWPQQACNYRNPPPGSVPDAGYGYGQAPTPVIRQEPYVSNVGVNAGYGRSCDTGYCGGAPSGPPARYSRY